MTLKISFVTAVVLALVVAAPAAGKGKGVSEQWQQALETRGAALNAQYGVGDTAQGTVNHYVRALEARSQALNEQHGLGVFAPGARGTVARAGEQGTPAYEQALTLRGEELNRRHELGAFDTTPAIAPDALERAVGNGPSGIETAHVRGDDFVLADPSDVPIVVRSTPSGSEFEWPQIGIGFLVGILLTLGIALTVRFTGSRPLMH